MSPAVAAGTVLAGFRIKSLIGEGAMATVYLAEEISTGARIALKLLSPELARDERFRRRFLRESQLAASLHHANIVPTIASGEDSGVLYLAMQYIEGSDLRGVLQRDGRLEPDRIVALVDQVAEALDSAHAAGLVHRDVKPGNILVAAESNGEHAYVCDFGLARHISAVSSLTGDRGFVGTIDYVPPEQIEGGSIDGRADVYSLGCVLYEALTGSRPFDRESELSVVFAHLNEPPPSASELRPELPQPFDDVFRCALAKAPADRYATCGELADAARAALHGKVFQRSRLTRRRLPAAAGAAAVAAAIAVAAVLATETMPASHGRAKITQEAIAGIALGHPQSYYKTKLGGYRPSIALGPNYPSLAFGQPEIAVYFPTQKKPARVITTWNPGYRTAEGIGPCSTLAQMNKAYGKRIQPSPHGTSPNGKVHWAWTLGRNLEFVTQDRKTISSVVLYRGSGGWATYLGANETPCK